MAEAGYSQPPARKDVLVLGKQALGMFLVGTDSMQASHYISDHDKKNRQQTCLCNGRRRFIRTYQSY